MELTKSRVFEEFRSILSRKVLLVIGTGPSVALNDKFGMSGLTNELKEKIPKRLDIREHPEWKQVEKALAEKVWIEKALDNVSNDDTLIQTIVQVTGDFVAELDREQKIKILESQLTLPLEPILRKLFAKLSDISPIQEIITTNYDLLIEHACDKHQYPCVTGFTGAIEKKLDWNLACEQTIYSKSIVKGNKRLKVERIRKHFRLYKPHGSINWFRKEGTIVEDNSLTYGCRKNERLIVTPGKAKYEKVLTDNAFRELIHKIDPAIKESKAYIFIGYGFNDSDIEANIEEQLCRYAKPGIIITKSLSDNAKALVKKADNLWAICEDGENNQDTLVYNKTNINVPLALRGLKAWRIDVFCEEVLGD